MSIGTWRGEHPRVWKMTADYLNRQLSARELEVLRLSSQGLTDKEIAQQIGVSLGTVHTYWTRIRSKCSGKTRAEIVSRHVRHQIMVEEGLGGEGRYAQGVLDSLPAVVMLFDTKLRLCYANRRLSSLVKHDESAIGSSLEQLGLDAECARTLRRGITQILAGGNGISLTDSKGFRCDFTRYPVSTGNLGILVIKIPPTTPSSSPDPQVKRYAFP